MAVFRLLTLQCVLFSGLFYDFLQEYISSFVMMRYIFFGMRLSASVVILLIFVLSGHSAHAQDKPRTNRLNPGDRLNAGDSIYSSDGLYWMIMQGDCNLVVYKKNTGDRPPIAQAYTNTQQKGSSCYLEMQEDGNLVIYDNPRRAVWYSNTQGHPGAYAILLPSSSLGHLVIYSGYTAIWNCSKFPAPCLSMGDRQF